MTRETVKGIAKFVSSFCVGGLTSLFLKQNVVPETKFQKLYCGIGGFIVGDYISALMGDSVGKTIDRVYDEIDGLNKAIEEKKKSSVKEEA